MNIQWIYFSDTNTPPGDIKTILEKKQFDLTATNRLERLHSILKKNEHSVLFIKAYTLFNVYELCKDISVLYPHVYIILIVPDNDENVKKAMHMGATDIIRSSFKVEELRDTIVQAIKYMDQRAKKDHLFINLLKEKSRVIAVTNPKGGVGKTSLTVNLAAAFARKGKSVAIIDANLQFGEAAVFLNLKPKRTVYEWTKEAFHKDGFPIDQYMTSHESNVSVLAAPSRPEFFEGILEDHLKVAIRECKEIYDVVLIDVPSSLSEIHIGCLEEADDILLVTLNEINVLRMSKLYLETLESVQLQDKVKLVLNRHEKGQALDLKRLAEVLKQEIYAILPDQAQVVSDAIKAGHPYFLSNSRSQLSKAIWSLSEKLIKKAEDQPVKKEKRWSLIKK